MTTTPTAQVIWYHELRDDLFTIGANDRLWQYTERLFVQEIERCLTEGQRAIIVRHYRDKKTSHEIEDELGISRQWVSLSRARALHRLRKAINHRQ